MLLKLPEWLSKNKNLEIPHKGKVVYNQDPIRRGRIKVVIEEFLTVPDIQNNGYKLPWIYPDIPYFLGSSNNAIVFSVPELNSDVSVFFPFSNIYFGFYRNHWGTKNIPSEFLEDYPNSFGWKDSTGTYQRVNKTQQYIESFHVSGERIRIYNDGMIEIFTPGKIDFVNSDDVDVETAGNMNIKVDGSVSIDAIETNINKLIVGDGASGVFTAQSGQVITVQNGIVIGIV